jgi:hypothetical protein
MVHALEECWRVLEPGGQLLDMRPIGGRRRVEVIAGSNITFTGQVDDSGGFPDDEAADLAVATILREGLFAKDRGLQFQFAYYWDGSDSLNGMKNFIEERWGDWAFLPEETLEKTILSIKVIENGAPYQLRICVPIQIVSYLKI